MNNFPRQTESRTGWPRLSDIVTPSEIKFIGEQIGASDDELKGRLRRLFACTPRLFRRAYLARVSYGDPDVFSVLLCVRHVDGIEETLQRGFKHMFQEIRRRGDSHDWLILDEAREQELSKVCKPFYEAV